jgi:hypothetical protein
MKQVRLSLSIYDLSVGPGDYDIRNLIGNIGVIQSHIKTPPSFSFSKTGLHNNSTDNMTVFNLNNGNYSTLKSLNKSAYIAPGVGDYIIDTIDVKNRSPVATIGRSIRFTKVPVLQSYKSNITASYQ